MPKRSPALRLYTEPAPTPDNPEPILTKDRHDTGYPHQPDTEEEGVVSYRKGLQPLLSLDAREADVVAALGPETLQEMQKSAERRIRREMRGVVHPEKLAVRLVEAVIRFSVGDEEFYHQLAEPCVRKGELERLQGVYLHMVDQHNINPANLLFRQRPVRGNSQGLS